MGSEQHRLCRKCLLKDMSEKEFFHNMYRYISNLPEDDKVSNSEYERRMMAQRAQNRAREYEEFQRIREKIRRAHDV